MDINTTIIELYNIMFSAAIRVPDKRVLMTMLGTLVDEWSQANHLSQEEALSIFETLAEVQKEVHNAIGY